MRIHSRSKRHQTLSRSKRQIQNLLASALQQNPGLVSQLQNNPTLLANLQSALLRDQRSQLTTSPNFNTFSGASLLPKPKFEIEPVDQCASLRKQNKRLKDLLHTLTADEIDEVHIANGPFLSCQKICRHYGCKSAILLPPFNHFWSLFGFFIWNFIWKIDEEQAHWNRFFHHHF